MVYWQAWLQIVVLVDSTTYHGILAGLAAITGRFSDVNICKDDLYVGMGREGRGGGENSCGKIWYRLANCGMHWQSCVAHGKLWQHVVSIGKLW